MSSTRTRKVEPPGSADAVLPFRDSEVLRSILDAAPMRVTYLDNRRRYRFANREFYSFTGLSPEEVIGRTVTQVLGRATAVRTRPHVKEARQGRTSRFEGWRAYPTAGRRYVDSAFAPVFRADGRMDGYFVLVRDLTEQRRREDELARRNRQLEEMLDAVPARVCLTDLDRRYRYVNREFCEFAGKRPEEIIGLTSEELVGPEVSAMLTPFVQAAQAGRTVTREGWVTYPEKRAAEEAMRRLNEALEERVRERTRALEEEAAERECAEEQLRQAQKMEAVGQLTGGIAHDFNNLLTGIVGALAILQRRVDVGRTEGLERYTGAAIASARRAAALTQRLLAFARRQPLDPKPVQANRLVAGMEDLLRRTLGPSIAPEMVLAGGLWPALCDPNQLESAVLNLAVNARDAMPQGGRLTIGTANAHLNESYARAQGDEVEPGQYVAVCVIDTGTGMAPEVAERAFEPFFTTTPLGQGTGLGLSMLYGFVKQSDGHVRIYTEPGRGTTFKLYLPRHRGSLEEAEAAAGPGYAPPRADAGETVLVVEDEAVVRMLILEVLAELSYAAVETADAAREARPGLMVLFITGYAHNATVGDGVLEAGTETLTKPFAVDALTDRIHSMIDKA